MILKRLLAVALAAVCQLSSSHARNFRVNLLPNGTENTCASCHVSPSGGGARNSFGQAVGRLVTPGGREEFWSPTLAAMDSDGDGVPNGVELGDPDGDGITLADWLISNPGLDTDVTDVPGYRQNFDAAAEGATDLGDGSGMDSTTGDTFVTGGALQLTSQEGLDSRGTFKSPLLDFEGVDSFTLRFDLTLLEDAGGNAPADGFSVNVGAIDPDPAVDPPGSAEEGYNEGLAIEFDTWDNGAEAEEGEFGIGVDVSVDGVTAEGGRARIDPAADRNNNALFKFDGISRPVEIQWRAAEGGQIDLLIDETVIFENLPVPDYTPSAADILAITGRTGGASETVLFDNLAINSPASPLLLSDPFIQVATAVTLNPVEVSQTADGIVSVSNRGLARELIISSATLGGINPDSFEVLTALPLAIAPGATGEIQIRAVGGDTLGALRADVTLITNDSNERRQSVVVSIATNVIPASIGTSVYTQDFDAFSDGETDLADGSLIFSNNDVAVVSEGRFQLTESGVGGSSAWWKLPPLGAQSTQGWVAIFDLALEATGTPADGFSFNFGPIPDEGGPSGAAEEGWGQGLAIEFDTYNNDGEGADNGIGVDVSVDGFSEDNWLNRVDGGADPLDNDIYQFDGISRLVVIRYEQTGEDLGVLNVTYGDLELFTDLEVTGFTPEADHRFAFAARTGGASETILMDNFVIIAPPVDTGVYRQDFSGFEDGATDLGDGSFIVSVPEGSTNVQEGALRLTEDGVEGSNGFYLLPALGEAQVGGFTATFEYALFESPGGNPPADGFSFNLGDIPEELPTVGVEEGLGGLAVEFDTWDNANATEEGEFGIGIDVSIGGQTLEGGRLRIDPGADRNDNEIFQFDGSPHKVTVSWGRENGVGQLTLLLDDEPIFTNLPTGDYAPAGTDRFAFAGRTGGATETVLIDNVSLIAPGIPVKAGRDPKIASSRSVGFSADAGSSATETLVVTNGGFSQELIISEIGLEGDQAGSFEILTQAPITIPADGTAMIEVRFNAGATSGERRVAQLFLVSNDSSPQARRRLIDLIGVATIPGGVYAQNFDSFADGTTDLGDGSVIHGSASAQILGGELQLTQTGDPGANGQFKVPALDSRGTQAFVATFDYSLFHADDADPINPADGFSFAFGDIADDAVGSEEGFGSGLAVEFDTWDNANAVEEGEFGIGIDVSVDGTTLEGGTRRIAEDSDRLDNELFVFDGSKRRMEVLWFRTGAADGLLTVTMDGEALFADIPTPGFDPQSQYRFAFAARTGGATQTVKIDNLNIVTGNEDPNLFAPSTFDVGLVQPGTVASVLMIPVRNTGQATPLNISDVVVTSSVPGVFVLQDRPSQIDPFMAGSIAVAFDPALATGLVTGEITISSDDPSEPVITIALGASVPLSGDLIAWYPLDETAAGELQDASGNGRNGSFVGDVELGQGALATGTAVQFNSTGDAAAYASIPSFPALQTLTVSLWAQSSGPDSSVTLISKSNPNTDAAYSLSLFPSLSNTLGIVVGEDANNLSAAVANQPLAAATHIVMVHEDANGEESGATATRIYINGIEAGLSEEPAGFADVEDVFQIGARVGANGFVGLLDDVQIYSRALTPEEITELFTNPGTPIGIDGGGPIVGSEDADNDGVSDADEAIAGTDPNDASDYFRPTVSGRTVDGFSFTFASVAGRAYSIEYSESLTAQDWIKLADITSTGTTSTFIDADGERLGRAEGYYRAVTE